MSNSPIQLRRLLWVGPLTIVAAVLAVQVVRFIILALLPEAKNAMQLGMMGISVVFTAVLVLGARPGQDPCAPFGFQSEYFQGAKRCRCNRRSAT